MPTGRVPNGRMPTPLLSAAGARRARGRVACGAALLDLDLSCDHGPMACLQPLRFSTLPPGFGLHVNVAGFGAEDQHPRCAEWAERGECEKNPKYMLQSCAVSCGAPRKTLTLAVANARASWVAAAASWQHSAWLTQ